VLGLGRLLGFGLEIGGGVRTSQHSDMQI